jgi:precorrin-3B methylase
MSPLSCGSERAASIGVKSITNGAVYLIALYNPVSRHRPTQLANAFKLIYARRTATTPVVLARDVGRPGERVRILLLSEVDLTECDMRTVILVGSSMTRFAPGGRVFTPRWYPPAHSTS